MKEVAVALAAVSTASDEYSLCKTRQCTLWRLVLERLSFTASISVAYDDWKTFDDCQSAVLPTLEKLVSIKPSSRSSTHDPNIIFSKGIDVLVARASLITEKVKDIQKSKSKEGMKNFKPSLPSPFIIGSVLQQMLKSAMAGIYFYLPGESLNRIATVRIMLEEMAGFADRVLDQIHLEQTTEFDLVYFKRLLGDLYDLFFNELDASGNPTWNQGTEQAEKGADLLRMISDEIKKLSPLDV